MIVFCLLAWMAVQVQAHGAEPIVEDFKGAPVAGEFTLGAMGGLGLINSTAGFALIGAAARQLSREGFIQDINDQTFVELELGPIFTSHGTAFVYGAHLRWDFQKDSQWTFFALGGLGGNVTGRDLGDTWDLFPRFGLGAFWTLSPVLMLRGELSHEWTTVGISFRM